MRYLAVLLALFCPAAMADLWTDCVLYNTSDPETQEIFTAEAEAPGATVVTDLSVFWLAPEVVAAMESGDKFIGVCRYAETYTLPVETHCVFRNPDYRYDREVQRWVFGPGWNGGGMGERQCWFKAGWEENKGYWGVSGTPEAGEWVPYTHPCADYAKRIKDGESLPHESSCDAYQWGGD